MCVCVYIGLYMYVCVFFIYLYIYTLQNSPTNWYINNDPKLYNYSHIKQWRFLVGKSLKQISFGHLFVQLHFNCRTLLDYLISKIASDVEIVFITWKHWSTTLDYNMLRWAYLLWTRTFIDKLWYVMCIQADAKVKTSKQGFRLNRLFGVRIQMKTSTLQFFISMSPVCKTH